MDINYCGYAFEDLTQLTKWTPPIKAGLYVILKRNEQYPKSFFDLIYVGESGNMAERGFNPNSDERKCWLKHVTDESDLYIATHITSCHSSKRGLIESMIIEEEKPPCNKRV